MKGKDSFLTVGCMSGCRPAVLNRGSLYIRGYRFYPEQLRNLNTTRQRLGASDDTHQNTHNKRKSIQNVIAIIIIYLIKTIFENVFALLGFREV